MTSLTLAHRRGIDRAKESLVEAAEALLTDAQVTEIPLKEFGHSQLRNLIAVALETESPAVVLNFIRYQMGRAGRNKGWANAVQGTDRKLGDRFIEEIEKGKVARALDGLPGISGDPTLRQLAQIELIRHFLGFASRYLKYLDIKRPPRDRGNGEGDRS